MTKKSLKDKLDGNELDLSLLNLADVPVKDIAALPKATEIDLSNNQLSNLPANFASSLKHITRLDLSSNKLKALPENIGLLENLTHLDLYNNQLTDLPVTFCQLRKLKWLDLKGNKLNPALRKVAGDCLNTKECEAAAKNVIQHLKQREIQIENERLQKLKKEQEMEARKKAEEERAKKQAEKKMKDKKKNESVPAPKAKVEAKVEAKAQANGKAPAPKNADPKPKKKEKKQRKARKSSSLGWLNWFLMLCLMGAVGAGVYIYTGGDFSEEGLNNAYAKLVENSHTLAELTSEAFQPDNLKETAQTVSKNIVECCSAAWAKLEEYTGDLSMYTTPVIEVTTEVLEWLKAKAIVCYEWLRDNVDWEYIFSTIKSGLKYLYDQCLHLCEELSKNETFMSGVETMKKHAASALEFLGILLASLWKQIIIALQYIQDEGPGILSAMKEQASGALHAAKQSFEGLIK